MLFIFTQADGFNQGIQVSLDRFLLLQTGQIPRNRTKFILIGQKVFGNTDFPFPRLLGTLVSTGGNSPSVLLRDIIIDGYCSRCRSLRRCCSRYRPIKRRILPVRYVVVPIFWLFITDPGIHIGDYCNREVFLILEGNLLATRIKQIVKISSIPVTIVNVLVWQQQVR